MLNDATCHYIVKRSRDDHTISFILGCRKLRLDWLKFNWWLGQNKVHTYTIVVSTTEWTNCLELKLKQMHGQPSGLIHSVRSKTYNQLKKINSHRHTRTFVIFIAEGLCGNALFKKLRNFFKVRCNRSWIPWPFWYKNFSNILR